MGRKEGGVGSGLAVAGELAGPDCVAIAAAAEDALKRADDADEAVSVDEEESHLSESLDAGLPRDVAKECYFSKIIALFVSIDQLVFPILALVSHQLSLGHQIETVSDLSLPDYELFWTHSLLLQTLKQLGLLVDVQILEEVDLGYESLAFPELFYHLAPED